MTTTAVDNPKLPVERDSAGVVTLTLRSSRPVVVLEWSLLKAINSALDEIESGGALKGFVLASDSRVFIAGADLKEIAGLSERELDEYLAFGQHVYGRIARLPCTSVAAVNGAVLGGGLEIAMHCDHLIGTAPKASPAGTPEKPSRPYPVGLPEAGLSICPGWGGTCLLPARIDAGRAITMTATGKTFTAIDAREAGLLEELVEPAADQMAFLAKARQLAMKPKSAPRAEPIAITNADRRAAARAAFEKVRAELPKSQAANAVADCIEQGLARGWQACLDAERKHLIRLRGTDEGKAAIKAFLEKNG